MPAPTLAELIETYGIGPNRARQNADFELQSFSNDDLRRILDQLRPLERLRGSSNICGPVYNRHVGFPIWMRATLWSMVSLGAAFLLPIQIAVAAVLLLRGQFKAIRMEVPVPTYEMLGWRYDMLSFVKAPLKLVRRSIEEGMALCVNREGRFSIRDGGYTVMSHVWAETMGWQTSQAWGSVTLELRKMGLARAHFLRFFDRCEAEWLWVDVLAMPEVLEDMNPAEMEETERLRVGVISCLHSIYTKAEKVVVIDTLLLRLSTRSPVDVAAVICLSFWITRLWTYTEARLAKRVVLKTHDSSFDLNTIIEFLGKTVLNDQHRYYGLAHRLLNLRDRSVEGYPPTSIMENAYLGGERRYTNVDVDRVRVLFPLFDLKWEYGWTLTQGLSKIIEAYPDDAPWVQKWCEYRDIEFHFPATPTISIINGE